MFCHSLTPFLILSCYIGIISLVKADDLTDWDTIKQGYTGVSGAGTDYQIIVTVHYGSGTDSNGHLYLNPRCNRISAM